MMRGGRRNTAEDKILNRIDNERKRDAAKQFRQLFTGRPYDLRRWRRLRLEQLHREATCRMHAALGVTTAATQVDHIQAIADGGSFDDPDNLRSLCGPCHSIVTRAWQTKREEPTARIKGVDAATGLPIDSQHWWNG